MRLSVIHQVGALERRRNVLISLREHFEVIARIRTGTGLGAITENLSEQLLDKLKPVIDADLEEQIVKVEAEMRAMGVTVD